MNKITTNKITLDCSILVFPYAAEYLFVNYLLNEYMNVDIERIYSTAEEQ